MKTQQAILKCQKKAWAEIKRIQNAKNMLEVEQCISDALGKTFGFWDKGVLQIQMRKLGQMGQFESIMRIRRSNWDNHMSTVRHYLIDMIPARMQCTLMYQKLIGRI